MATIRAGGRRRAGAEAGALLALGLFALAVTAPVLRGGVPVATDTLTLWGPPATGLPATVHNPVLADSALLYLPWQVFVRGSLAGGEWPLWNPAVFAGYPFLGNAQNELYYPIAWLLLLLPLAAALQANAVLHVWLAGAGMYLWARTLGVSRAGAGLAALAFAASGQLYMMLELTGPTDIYVWLPWVLAAAEVAWRRRSWAWTATAGLLFGVLAVAGHLSWLLYSGVFLAAWLATRVAWAAWVARRATAPGARRAVAGQAARAAAILAWGPAARRRPPAPLRSVQPAVVPADRRTAAARRGRFRSHAAPAGPPDAPLRAPDLRHLGRQRGPAAQL